MMKRRLSKALIAFIIPFLLSVVSARGEVARDPGPRPTGVNDQPQPLDGLTSGQAALFNAGMAKFQEREAVKDGLAPTMNDRAIPTIGNPIAGSMQVERVVCRNGH